MSHKKIKRKKKKIFPELNQEARQWPNKSLPVAMTAWLLKYCCHEMLVPRALQILHLIVDEEFDPESRVFQSLLPGAQTAIIVFREQLAELNRSKDTETPDQ